ncbi:MAG: hypothetical protein AAF587_26225 [Bacteroidota bacterium]
MKKHILLLCLICLGAQQVRGQSYHRQRVDFAFLNLGLNACVGGLGALINKHPGEKAHRVFLKGFGQGLLGGTLSYYGKGFTYQIHKHNQLRYSYLAKLTHAAGASITQNAACNRNFWERWHLNVGLFRLEYEVLNKQFHMRILPSTVVAAIAVGSQSKLNLRHSLAMGTVIMEKDGDFTVNGLSGRAIGYSTIIGIDQNIVGEEFYYLMAHEALHTLQYDHMIWLNPLFYKPDKQWKKDLKWYQQLSKYLYFDLNGISIWTLYFLQRNQPWECRWIEREADIFSAHIAHPGCP